MKCDIKTISSEPYIELKSKKFSKKNEIIYNQTLRNKSKYNFFQKAFDFIYDNKVEGDYFEFGTHRARTFRFCLREANIKNMEMNFFAFDSFKGLPKVKDNFKQSLFDDNKLIFNKKTKEWRLLTCVGDDILKFVNPMSDNIDEVKLKQKIKGIQSFQMK